MMNINSNKKNFKKSVKAIPGLSAEMAERTLNSENKRKKMQDSENRNYVYTTVINYVRQGKTINEAIDLIMHDDIVNKFEYFTKNGIDLRRVFYNWTYKNAEKIQKEIENEEER